MLVDIGRAMRHTDGVESHRLHCNTATINMICAAKCILE
ncbi:hypothetical protein KT71_001594 [Congregibacter litoralis KT71]|uniref:Uncharacterized protein n=1 Tax=Congregibacter litoralis KT71 TaxID=314285 RepID=V7HT47_9GAMM|nr:hypothetical protein KT71_001594 [Congregibacter litoralis KT71]